MADSEKLLDFPEKHVIMTFQKKFKVFFAFDDRTSFTVEFDRTFDRVPSTGQLVNSKKLATLYAEEVFNKEVLFCDIESKFKK